MAWSESKIFMSFLENAFENTNAVDLDTDTLKAALFDNTITPDQTVATAAAAYLGGVWLTGPEVEDTTEWDAGGEPITSVASGFSSNVYTFDAADTPSGGTSATLADVYGVLVYDSSTGSAGICFCYLGGVNSVTDGTFTIVWNGSGIFTVTA